LFKKIYKYSKPYSILLRGSRGLNH